MTNIRSGYAVMLKNRDFASLWAAQLVSQLGDAIFNVALLWIILSRTDSAAALASAMLVLQSFYLATFVFAGLIVDRVNRKRIMIAADLVRGAFILVFAVFIFQQKLEMGHIYLLAAIDGMMTALFSSAKAASVPMMVKGEDLVAANALNAVSSNVCNLLGPALGGILISIPGVGMGGAALINAASFFIGAAGLLWIRNTDFTPTREKEGGESMVESLVSAAKYTYARPDLLRLSYFSAAFNFVSVPLFVLLPMFARNTLDAGPAGFGMMEGFLFAGALFGAAVVASIGERYRRGRRMMVPYIVQSLVMTMLCLTEELSTALPTLFLYGVISVAAKSLLTSYLQLKVENQFRGRVFSFLYLASDGLVPVSMALTGLLAGRYGFLPVMVGSGVCATLIAAWGLFIHREADSNPEGP